MWTARWRDPAHGLRPVFAAGALLVVAASMHCAWEWQDVLRQFSAAGHLRVERQPIPLGWPRHGCPNEFGCLCRGATLAQSVSIGDLKRADFGLERLLPDRLDGVACVAPLALQPSAVWAFRDTACSSFLSGGSRRARLGCFLI